MKYGKNELKKRNLNLNSHRAYTPPINDRQCENNKMSVELMAITR